MVQTAHYMPEALVHITHYRYHYLSDIPVEVPRNMSTAPHHYQNISQSGVSTLPSLNLNLYFVIMRKVSIMLF